MRNCRKISVVSLLAVLLFVVCSVFPVFATGSNLQEGTYQVDASLSCYISAMGGVEFGDGIFDGAKVTVDESGNAKATLNLKASSVTIYSVTCDTFIDASDSIPAYYEDGARKTAEYTKSSNTALNGSNEAVNYVDSITFPVTQGTDTYYLYLYVNSNVMGTQFSDGKESDYPAIFKMDWSSAATEGSSSSSSAAEGSTTTSSNVENMDGLSIYRTDDSLENTEEEVVQTEEATVSEWQYVYNPILIYVCIGIGIVFILMGGMFLIFGNQKNEKVVVIRFEIGTSSDRSGENNQNEK